MTALILLIQTLEVLSKITVNTTEEEMALYLEELDHTRDMAIELLPLEQKIIFVEMYGPMVRFSKKHLMLLKK